MSEWCRSCGATIYKGKTYVRVQIWKDDEIQRHLGHFCDYKCLDDWKMDRDLVVD